MRDIIVHHEDWQPGRYERFLAERSVRQGVRPPPGSDRVQGEVRAEVNQGRWIAHCPMPGCGGAVCLSRTLALFWCTNCGNASNGGLWYAVRWPETKGTIEAILLKRPAWHPFRGAQHRNWTRETLAQLRAENKQQGID